MSSASTRTTPSGDIHELALRVADNIPAMVAYWDQTETCRFANAAYLSWFGKTREQLLGHTLQELLGPLYELNLPYIRAAYSGREQHFERSIPRPGGGPLRESIATYVPDVRDGVVRGIFVHVADSGALKENERALTAVIEERDRALAEVRTLRGLLPVCAHCKDIRTEHGEWVRMERYVAANSHAEFSHGLCPKCLDKHYPEME